MDADVNDAISPAQAAQILGVKRDTIRQLRRKNLLETIWIDNRTAWVTRKSTLAYNKTRKACGRPKLSHLQQSS